jgi:hypothetical protein
MALASVVRFVDYSRRRKVITLGVTFSGSYTTGGDTLDLTATTNPKYFVAAKFGTIPVEFVVCNDAGGCGFEWVPGTTLANGKVKVFSAANTELAAGAYNAALTGDTLILELSVKSWVM